MEAMFASLISCKVTPVNDLVVKLGSDSVTSHSFICAVDKALAKGSVSGSFNGVAKLGKDVCVRVSKAPFCDDDAAPAYWEMSCARQMHAIGVGLRLICFGIVNRAGRRRFVSCWPWVESAVDHVSGLTATGMLEFGEALMDVIHQTLKVCIHAESFKMSNVVITPDGAAKLIDFDGRYARFVYTDEQRVAASKFGVVYMIVLECMCPGLFTMESVARVAGVRADACHVADAAVRATRAVLAAFDTAFSTGIIQLIQMYVAFGIKSHISFADGMRVLGNDEEWAERLLESGTAVDHIGVLIRASVYISFLPTASNVKAVVSAVRRSHVRTLKYSDVVPDTDDDVDMLVCRETLGNF